MSLLERIKKLEQQVNTSQQIHVVTFDDSLLIDGDDGHFLYRPFKTCSDYHACDDRLKVIMGPFGSGKTVANCCEVLLRAIAMPPMQDGVRRSKTLFFRNTYMQLVRTTFNTWYQVAAHLGVQIVGTKNPPVASYVFYDEDGRIELTIVGIALDSANVERDVKSLDLTNAFGNELSELPEQVIDFVDGRVGRFPAQDQVDRAYYNGIFGDTNAPDNDHWIYKRFEIEKPEGQSMFRQPPGLIWDKSQWILNPLAENVAPYPQALGFGLTKEYYLNLVKGKSKEYIKKFILGEYSAMQAGKAIYAEYNDDIHSDEELTYNPELPICLGWDFGLTPAVCIAQVDGHGRLRLLDELTSKSCGLEQFISVLLTHLVDNYAGYTIAMSVGDPAGSQRMQTDEVTCLMVLEEYGISTTAAITNAKQTRWDAVRWYLNTNREGEPALILNSLRCKLIRKGFLGGYRFKRLHTSVEAFSDQADKTEESHVHDGLQYLCLELNRGNLVETHVPTPPVTMYRGF